VFNLYLITEVLDPTFNRYLESVRYDASTVYDYIYINSMNTPAYRTTSILSGWPTFLMLQERLPEIIFFLLLLVSLEQAWPA